MVKKKVTDQLVAIHPGEYLREDFLKPLALSVNALALALRVPATRIADIVNERRSITIDTAIRLSLYFETTPDYWLRMQTAYELAVGKAELMPRLKKEVQPRVA
jgi:addiction module HigA family antidote